ncbi:MAG: Inner membrane transport permease YbhR [bacterium ADurb.Bin400]|nr:MAG: Inner membrane transport permease YbhR [bacterium ADurb.Bin400]
MWQLFIANVIMTVRNKQALFWNLMFPLMFTFIFGMFFGGGNTKAGTIAVINHSVSETARVVETTLREGELFNIADNISAEEGRKKVERSEISAVVEIPEGFGSFSADDPKKIKITYDPGNAATRAALVSYLDAILNQISYKAQNASPLFSVEEEKTNSRQFSYFDFVLVGLIGMALMNSSVQGVAITLAKYREDKILKRVTTTPLSTWKFVSAEILSRLIVNFVQVSLILLVGVHIFNAHIYGNVWLIFLLSLLGAVLFQAVGFAIASMSKTTQAAEGMSTAITIPMMFLAGVFFPIDQLPKWLGSVVQYLPLAPLLRMIRGIALEESSPLANPANLSIVLVWIAVMLAVTLYRFRMSEE